MPGFIQTAAEFVCNYHDNGYSYNDVIRQAVADVNATNTEPDRRAR